MVCKGHWIVSVTRNTNHGFPLCGGGGVAVFSYVWFPRLKLVGLLFGDRMVDA